MSPEQFAANVQDLAGQLATGKLLNFLDFSLSQIKWLAILPIPVLVQHINSGELDYVLEQAVQLYPEYLTRRIAA